MKNWPATKETIRDTEMPASNKSTILSCRRQENEKSKKLSCHSVPESQTTVLILWF